MSDPVTPTIPAPDTPTIDVATLQKEIDDLRTGNRTAEEALATARKELARLQSYEGAVKAEVESLARKLGDKVPDAVKQLDASLALPILKTLDTALAGPPAVRPTTNGNPAGPAVPPDFAHMNPAERRAFLQTLPHDELVKLNGGGRDVSPLAFRPKE